jgi:two-component system, sensor histidine kinase and response regulator
MKQRILVIDDDAVMRSLLHKLLEIGLPGVEVVEATDGLSGERMARSNPFVCIVLDHVLPDATGMEVLRAIRSRDRNTPIVILTGFGDEGLAVEMMKSGADDYVSKVGFSSERFLRAVRTSIANAETRLMASV